ncbi:MAG TPA: sterol desaturase family protein [Bacteriovoracaceae bacterium]|nr:sterol desaturase family protein [Bacteriovoracaceae bacterium]
MEKIVVLAIPLYFGSLFLEAWLSAKQGKGFYKLKDSVGNVGTGIIMQMLEIFSKGLLVAGYVYVYDNYNLARKLNLDLWSDGILSWIFVFLIIDCLYYFFHRHSHEINILWAAHVVHHSSEEYNFSVALRQSAFQGIFFSFYMLLLAVAGMPTLMVLSCYGINIVYQFFLHTRFIGKLGWAEKILSTPSHHRVHHARQGKYLDRNYGVFPRFQSYDPVRANLMPIKELFFYFRKAQGKDKWHVLFSGPLWIFENFKKGKNLNIIDSKAKMDHIGFAFFMLALLFVLMVLFIPDLPAVARIIAIMSAFVLLAFMGRRLDRTN